MFLYRPIKYKDDGRELVSWFEFITIHVTFPVLNAWVSYVLLYEVLVILANTCEYPINVHSFQWCKDPNNYNSKELYYYELFLVPS